MSGIVLGLNDLRTETVALCDVAAPLLDISTRHQLRNAVTQLDNMRHSAAPSAPRLWSIPEDHPLLTIPSHGQYRPGGGGTLNVVGEISFEWSVTPQKARRGKGNIAIEVTGAASTRVRIRDVDTGEELGMWRMEIGTRDAPGSVFHIQIRGQDKSLPFPDDLRVPRFPTFVPTPATVTEFVLSELFQDDWAREFAQSQYHKNDWVEVQRERMTSWLNLQSQELARARGNSPILFLKHLFPHERAFID